MSLAKEEEGQPLLAKMDSLLCCTRRRRRIILRRLLACTIGLTVLCLFFFPSVVFSEQIPSPLQYASNFGRRDTDHDSHLSTHQGDSEGDAPQPQIQIHNPFKPKEPEPPKVGKAAAPKAEEYAKAPPRRPQQQVQQQQQQQYQQPVALTDDQNNDEDLEKSLRKLDSLLPDEDIMEHLLSPLPETGGPPLLRDLASRTRKFKEAFKAWEDLHLFMQGDQILRREDVTQRLRRSNLPWPIVQGSIHVYDTFRLYISSFGQRLFPWTMPFYGDHMSLHTSFYNGGRGLVYTGGDRQLHFIETSIKALRKLGCSLPVEILYLGDEDLREENRERLESLPGVLTRDISEQIEDAGWQLKGWAAKPFAILMSTFREVIFIDADALFFVNPEVLFENRKYVETGTLFFKDRNLLPENRRTWLKSILPKPISHHVKKNRMWTGESGHMQDSGVIVVDKWRHFIPLLLTTRLNGPDRDGNKSKGKKGIYEMVYGDKETFWISWELAADLDYAFHDSVAGSMGSLQADDSDKPGTKIPEKPKTPAKDDKAKAEKAKAEKDKKKAEDEEDEDDEFYDDEEEEEEEEEEDIEEKGSTVCSAQLLHFDEDGTPLWFNGWIAKTKFDKDSLKAGRVFEGYMKEHRETGKHNPENPWRIKQSNVVCLKGQEYFPFTPEEQETLAMIMAFAQDDD